ncbi:MAG TPA: zf-HC2 domain-containing protein [Streptosporangiaceae bacterium]|nr:zf-HC2 domain-containing protein [Streptosporangiaceae bacterium]
MMIHLGVYALGAADDQERTAVASHLLTCAECRAELARLEPLPGLLARVPESRWAAEPHAAPQPAAAASRAAARLDSPLAAASMNGHAVGGSGQAGRPPGPGAPARPGLVRRMWSRPWQAIAATAAAAAAAGVAGGIWLAQPEAATVAAPAITASGANPATHVRATVSLTGTSWGTSIRLTASGLPLNVPCRLIVHSRTGDTEVTGVWDAWSKGPITVPASAGWRPADIVSLQVATASRTLVTITTGRPGSYAPPASSAPAQSKAPPSNPGAGQ